MAEVLLTSVDGEIVAPADARIPVADDGLLRGDGVFEVVKLYAGRPFRLDPHLDRLERSAAKIELPIDRGALEAEIEAILERAAAEDLGLRILTTRGGRRLVIAERIPDWPASATVALIDYTPSEILGGVKSISYAANMQSARIAAARGADEPVWVRPDGVVLEAPTSAVFWADADGRLRTPALECRILDSITRAVVIERTDVEQGSFDRAELEGANEAFLASTTREIQPISAIDGVELAACPGELTREASGALATAIADELGDPDPLRLSQTSNQLGGPSRAELGA